MEKTLKKRIDDLHAELVLKEGIVTDYILFQAVKTTFKLKSLNIGDFMMIRSVIQKVIKDKKIN